MWPGVCYLISALHQIVYALCSAPWPKPCQAQNSPSIHCSVPETTGIHAVACMQAVLSILYVSCAALQAMKRSEQQQCIDAFNKRVGRPAPAPVQFPRPPTQQPPATAGMPFKSFGTHARTTVQRQRRRLDPAHSSSCVHSSAWLWSV